MLPFKAVPCFRCEKAHPDVALLALPFAVERGHVGPDDGGGIFFHQPQVAMGVCKACARELNIVELSAQMGGAKPRIRQEEDE